MFKRVGIVNRGEVASRILKTLKILNIDPVLFYSEADKEASYLQSDVKKVCIGPGPSVKSYLNREVILKEALKSEVSAIHPGFGFLAEDFLFASMCEQQKLTFIGPSANYIRSMGDKSNSKKIMKKAGLNIIPGSDGALNSLEEAIDLANDSGYPVILKATAGGGGKGIRVCLNRNELKRNFLEASMEAEKNFGNKALYLEKVIVNGKHIEFQILADSYGNIVNLGDRECSIQRKKQKLIEESPSPSLNIRTRKEIEVKMISALKKTGYLNAGTMEFLLDERGELYFMEMNTRLQVEHPVTEMVTGIDIVSEQIKIAANHPLSFSQEDIMVKGHSIECRINAEDPTNNFAPDAGLIEKFEYDINCGPGKIRIDTHISSGYQIPPYYDSMLCKLIVHGKDREEAILTMKNGLKNILIKGVKTTIPLLLEIIEMECFLTGNYNTQSLEKYLESEVN